MRGTCRPGNLIKGLEQEFVPSWPCVPGVMNVFAMANTVYQEPSTGSVLEWAWDKGLCNGEGAFLGIQARVRHRQITQPPAGQVLLSLSSLLQGTAEGNGSD